MFVRACSTINRILIVRGIPSHINRRACVVHLEQAKIIEPHTELPGLGKRSLQEAASKGFRLFVLLNATLHTDFVMRAAKLYTFVDTLPQCRELCLR